MANDKIFSMKYSKVYPLIIAKAERKGRSKEEVHMVTTWMTGYSSECFKGGVGWLITILVHIVDVI